MHKVLLTARMSPKECELDKFCPYQFFNAPKAQKPPRESLDPCPGLAYLGCCPGKSRAGNAAPKPGLEARKVSSINHSCRAKCVFSFVSGDSGLNKVVTSPPPPLYQCVRHRLYKNDPSPRKTFMTWMGGFKATGMPWLTRKKVPKPH